MTTGSSVNTASSRSTSVLVVLQCAMLTAIAVVLGQLLAAVPNVELVTLTVFVAGIVGGVSGGVTMAVTTTLCFNYLNPMGPVILPVLIVQAVAWSIVAAGGALYYKLFRTKTSSFNLAVAGALVTLQYQILMNGAYFVFFTDRWNYKQMVAVLIGAISFSITHVAWNFVAFHILGKPLIDAVKMSTKAR